MKVALLPASILFTVLVFSALAQDLVVDVNLTMLDVLVEDQKGHAVLDLTADDLEVLEENGQIKPVKHLSLEREPIALGLLVDRSSSIGPVRKDLDLAVARLLEASDSDDQAFLMTFAGTGKLNVAPTTERKNILEAVRKTKLELGTRFYDVLINSLQYLSRTRLERKALIVFSDGADHFSINSFAETLDAARLYGYPIYFFGYVGDDSRTWSREGRREIRNQFEQLARLTGGKVMFPLKGTDCSEIARNVLNSMRYTYRLGFYSSEPWTQPSAVQVRLRGERTRSLTIWVTPIPAL